ncbi:hypothetical protein E3N88_07220 [Mikania micrantha]|uniref:Uncharacterized protein n=1 Tax=Mikania micrantha TaxID=192012 RepID=A0A5N6PQX8_9ASTR|nr:hypothetical protein E3N88_07220 [Mikania micrantha]
MEFGWWFVRIFRLKGEQMREEEENKNSCMKSDEVDQITAPPHPSRTATRCQKGLRVPRRFSGISDICHSSRTAKEAQPLHRNDQM